MSDTFGDAEGAIVSYLRATTTAFGTRVFLALAGATVYPVCRVGRVGGGDDPSDAPLDQALLQIDVYGRVRQLAEAESARQEIRSALKALSETGGYNVPGKAYIYGATVADDRRLPEPNAQDADGTVGERPRFIITAQVVVGPPRP